MSTASKRSEAPPTPDTRHEDDLYTWVQEQVALLRAGKLSDIDAANVAEELSDVGSEQLDKLESAITVLAMHLLKWDHQPKKRSRSWELTIREQRRRIAKLLRKNPGLKAVLEEALADAYLDGRDRALAETDLPTDALPAACPYPFDAMMARSIEFQPPAKKRKRPS